MSETLQSQKGRATSVPLGWAHPRPSCLTPLQVAPKVPRAPWDQRAEISARSPPPGSTEEHRLQKESGGEPVGVAGGIQPPSPPTEVTRAEPFRRRPASPVRVQHEPRCREAAREAPPEHSSEARWNSSIRRCRLPVCLRLSTTVRRARATGGDEE